ncbi:MAG: ABC transporter substrate-binding protein [Patescibacteria group bacterium]|nr:ABC transporter substrate-binding protein [Patescibacteria group bacterium]
MKDIIPHILKKEFKIPKEELLSNAVGSFSATEKIIFSILSIILIISATTLVWQVNQNFLVGVPADGGSFSEGIIGTPRFINPVIAIGDAERDMTSLIYSGLLKANSEGKLIPDLAKNYTISDDGLTYTFYLKDNIFFHDNTPVTTNDIEFTIARVQDPSTKSPKRANWDGVIIEKVTEKQIRFILKKPYSPFIENTTIGILPKHIWKNVNNEEFAFSQFNIEPIGSGPYEIKNIYRDSGGLIQYYELSSFKKYALGKPYISTIFIKFYPNEKALLSAYTNGSIQNMNSIAPQEARLLKMSDARIETISLPRIFAVFLNQNNAPLFSDQNVRKALNIAMPKEVLVQEVLQGYATSIDGPIPSKEKKVDSISFDDRINEAKDILAKDGWEINKDGILEKKTKKSTTLMQFSLVTSNAPELKQSAEIIKDAWTKLGAEVTVKIFDSGDLNQNIIKTRKYDALLFGEIVGRDLDLFAFWHSSQRNDPGLNIAMYVNSKVDKILEDVRSISDTAQRKAKYEEFDNIIHQEIPALFAYSPDFIYVMTKNIKGFSFGQVTTPGDRFADVNKWYINTDQVWKIFVNS